MFTHLHLHTEHSLLDGLIKVKPLVKKLKELGMNSCAITDHGVMYGLYEFWSECKANGIKPIIGCEVYVAPRSRFRRDKKRYHLTLLAKNEVGYHNLIKLCSLGHLEGFYTKPRVDRELLRKYSEGIIATTGCAASPVNKNLMSGKIKRAYSWAKFFKSIFSDFYVEVQKNGIAECENAIPLMLKLATDLELPVVATCDSHYLNKGDENIQEINWCIRDAKLMSDDTRNKKWSNEFYVKSDEEMRELFKDIPEAVENTQKIADSVEIYSIKYDRIQPLFWNKPDGISAKEILLDLCMVGAARRYPTPLDHKGNVVCDEWVDVKIVHYDALVKIDLIDSKASPIQKVRKDILERLNYELEVIHNKGYDDYFLVVSDFQNWGKKNGILCGVRGSAGGALSAYTCGITELDPLRWELYFERFLNPERMSPPDIDCDIDASRRHEVVEYIVDKYGQANCSLINALGRLKTRAAIRDVSRVMGIDLKLADQLSKMVIVKFGKPYSASEMMDKVEEFRTLVNSDPRLVNMIEVVKKIENMPRQTGTHACGLLMTPKPVMEYVPLQFDKEHRVTCQLEMKPLEELGLMKFDILGLTNLSIISNTLKLISHYKKIDVDIWKLPQDDALTFQLLQRADTDAVFQLESEGMKKYLKELVPSTVDDICFMCAAYRPGPMQFIPPYIQCKHGLREPEYLIEELKPILSNTFGYAIYQEQVIRIAVDIAGYTLGQADILRRAMGKKVKEIMEGEKIKFVDGCIAKGFSEEVANKLFDYLLPFADYGFNKSHSAGYAMIAYQTAYLKAHYPIEFVAGLMQSDLLVPDKLKRDIQMAKDKSIEVLSPSINHSELIFSIESSNSIRFGLGGIKTISRNAMEQLIEERKNGKYKNFDDFIVRMIALSVTKSCIETLVKVGACDEFGNRAQLLQMLPELFSKYSKKPRDANQEDLFSILILRDEPIQKIEVSATPLPLCEDIDNKTKVSWEIDYLGTFFSEHPLNIYQEKATEMSILPIENVHTLDVGSKVQLLAIMKTVKKIFTKKDGKPMAFAKFEDLSGEIEGVLFNTSYEKILQNLQKNNPGANLKENEVYYFTGKVSERDFVKSIMVDEMILISSPDQLSTIPKKNLPLQRPIQKISNVPTNIPFVEKIEQIKIDLSNINDIITLQKIKNILKNHLGAVKVFIKLKQGEEIVERSLANGIEYNEEVKSVLIDYLY